MATVYRFEDLEIWQPEENFINKFQNLQRN